MPDYPDDPIDSDDPQSLRHEILRQRDSALGLEARNEVLEDRVAELEAQVEALGAEVVSLRAQVVSLRAQVVSLRAELRRHPLVRIARRAARPLRRG